MPTYAYACKNCGHAFDIVQSFSEDSLTVCPECEGVLRKKFSSVGVVFKGSGFYRTDSRSASVAASHGSGESTGQGSHDSHGSTSSESNGAAKQTGDSSAGSSTGSTSGSSSGEAGSGSSSGSTSGSSSSSKAKAGSAA